MIHEVSLYFANRIAKYTNLTEKTDLMTYGLEMIIGESFKFLILLFISFYLGLLNVTLLILLAALPFRFISGGGHCTTFMRCSVTTISVYLALSILAQKIYSLIDFSKFILGLPVLVGIALLVILLWVPGTKDNLNLESVNQQIKYKVYSIIYLVIWLMGYGLLVLIKADHTDKYLMYTCIGIMWQVIFVSPLGYLFLAILEKTFNLIKPKGGEMNV